MRDRHLAWLRLALAIALPTWVHASPAEPPTLRIVAPTNQSMPMLRMARDLPVEGLLKDLGELLAQRLGLRPVFVALPSKRAGPAVASGSADLLCYVKPEWLDGKVLWTQFFLPGAGVIAAGPAAQAVSRLSDLRDQALGTVLGYRYPVLDQAFGQPVRRQDAVDAQTNLHRLSLGRVQHAVTDRATLAYYMKAHPQSGLREVMEVERQQLGCALSPQRADLLRPLDQTIVRMQADGSLDTLLNRYR
ncbi:substrate-binding periplasmic protein [Roseateles sp. LYH14W]|uniref:Substrate-binding periplasmic protein n=1 Tax=Pelomonas parva TaxID=3299032 RepID=A0ABW7FAL5_9BURK